MNKIAALQQILQQDPADAFARHGLAMVYLNQGDTEAALAEFARVIESDPDYVPAFHMSALTRIGDQRAKEAINILLLGIAAAQRTGDTHAADEMQCLLEALSAELATGD
jgi:thioredoxin-like negative regulator of GroEL